MNDPWTLERLYQVEHAETEVAEQQYRWFRDSVTEVGLPRMLLAVMVGAQLSLYDVDVVTLMAWVNRFRVEHGDPPKAGADDLSEAVARQEQWAIRPRHANDHYHPDFHQRARMALASIEHEIMERFNDIF